MKIEYGMSSNAVGVDIRSSLFLTVINDISQFYIHFVSFFTTKFDALLKKTYFSFYARPSMMHFEICSCIIPLFLVQNVFRALPGVRFLEHVHFNQV